MWIRQVHFRMDSADAPAARKQYKDEAMLAVLTAQPGFRWVHLLESADTPGEYISLTAWDSRADAEAYDASGVYAQMKSNFTDWLIGETELKSYEVFD